MNIKKLFFTSILTLLGVHAIAMLPPRPELQNPEEGIYEVRRIDEQGNVTTIHARRTDGSTVTLIKIEEPNQTSYRGVFRTPIRHGAPGIVSVPANQQLIPAAAQRLYERIVRRPA